MYILMKGISPKEIYDDIKILFEIIILHIQLSRIKLLRSNEGEPSLNHDQVALTMQIPIFKLIMYIVR